MISFLLFVVFVTVLLDAMDANVQGFLHKYGPWFRNNWKVKYKPDGTRKWWVYLGGASFIDFWHTAKSILLYGTFTYAAILSGLAWWWGFVGWCIFGFLHEHVFYRRWK